MNRRKLIGLVASVLVAGLGTLVLLKYANSSKGTPQQAAAEPTVPVLKVQRLIPKGTPAEQLADSVAVEQVPVSQKLNDAADNVGLLAGLVASTDLLPAEQVVKARFIPAAEQKKQEIGQGTGLIGVWVTLEPIRALNGRVQVNDTVAVFGTFNGTNPAFPVPANEQSTNPTTHLSIHKVPVLDVIGNVVETAPAAADGQTPAVVAPAIQVKLGVSAPDAERLVFAASFGSLWLGSEDLDVPEEGTKVVDRSNVYDDTLKVSPTTPPAANPVSDATTAQDAKTVAAVGSTPAATDASATAPTTVATAPKAAGQGAKPATNTPPVVGAPVAPTVATVAPKQ